MFPTAPYSWRLTQECSFNIQRYVFLEVLSFLCPWVGMNTLFFAWWSTRWSIVNMNSGTRCRVLSIYPSLSSVWSFFSDGYVFVIYPVFVVYAYSNLQGHVLQPSIQSYSPEPSESRYHWRRWCLPFINCGNIGDKLRGSLEMHQ